MTSDTAPAEPPKPGPKTRAVMPSSLRHLGGSNDDQFNLHLAKAVLATVWQPSDSSDKERGDLVGVMATAMSAFEPADEIEAMIAAQAVALHHASMECSRRAMIPDQGFEAGREFRKAAANASRAFTELLAALDRKRGKGGQQKVVVEHVHVHKGGKAIVGAVGPATGGGGGEEKSRAEPRASPARLAHDAAIGTVLPPVLRAHPEREPVPIARDAERPVPDARRR